MSSPRVIDRINKAFSRKNETYMMTKGSSDSLIECSKDSYFNNLYLILKKDTKKCDWTFN